MRLPTCGQALHFVAGTALLLAATACNTTTSGPAITEVRPAAVAPGGLVLVSGHGLDRHGEVRVDGRPMERVVWVNGALAAVVLPADLAPGVRPLQVRFPAGRESVFYLTVLSPSALPPVVEAAPPPAATATAAPQPPPAAAPTPPAGRDDNAGHEDKGKGKGRGR